MRGKRSKQYRKLMQQYGIVFGFREPYQVLVDAQIIQDAERFKMDLVGGLERTLSGKVKPMITQCSIRHLYTLKDLAQPEKDALISTAKTMERRRCNHHILDEPLSTLACLSSVIDPKESRTNKNRYVVASQGEDVRRSCREIRGVPLVYVKRSIMVMEPMAEGSVGIREGIERSKFRSGLRGRGAGLLGKRKRKEDEGSDVRKDKHVTSVAEDEVTTVKKKKTKGPKGPNPLSVKKGKKELGNVLELGQQEASDYIRVDGGPDTDTEPSKASVQVIQGALEAAPNPPAKRKRRRRHKSQQLDLAAALNSGHEENE
ncbi:hypothetical protein N7G274_005737 [Stereocaulon virgatum]|uniref:UTP23 sensor motif region domain-containing protein n=1 Tax=Stereocaulon virgatum TaxID=373712 RepID=A0ABR4A8C9_9LECA